MKRFFQKLYTDSQAEFQAVLKEDLQAERKRFIVTANPETFMIGSRNEAFARMLLDDETTIVPDGIGVVKAANMLSIPVKERIPGVEIAASLMKSGDQLGASIYLFGAKAEVIEAMKQLLSQHYPNLRLIGCSDGYVANKDQVFDEIAQLQPDIVLVAMGIPAQEQLIYRHLGQFKKGIFVGVGGSFDVLSGMKKRAPALFIKCNLEWLYRILSEPSRWKRFYNNNIKFIHMVRKMKKRG